MEHRIDQLSEYLDETLPIEERLAIEAHLASCATCSATLEELRGVVLQARALEFRAPEVDLWPGIAARLAPRRQGIGERLGAWFSGRRFSFTFPQLAAATAAVVMIAVGLTWVTFQRAGIQQVAVVSNPAPSTTPTTSPSSATAPVTPTTEQWPAPRPPAASPGEEGGASAFASFDAARYDAAVAELQRVLNEHRDDLDSTTVRILEQNLAIIDRATEEARRALLADPANPYLNGHLAQQMRLKIRLLQRAADVVAAHS